MILDIQPEKEITQITHFLKKTFEKQKTTHAVLGLSGGIDSVTSLFLLRNVLPKENIYVAHLSYFPPHIQDIERVVKKAGIPQKNLLFLSIQEIVDSLVKTLSLSSHDTFRMGNIMARVRMIMLYDLAKKHQALVCGTENKSEDHLGYFTRFGDEASDIEPIKHLYKTQVYQLASSLGVPEFVLKQQPTAGLWQGQTDEKEFGFSYQEADQVLYLYFDKQTPLKKIVSLGYPNAKKIITRVTNNSFKHDVPYTL